MQGALFNDIDQAPQGCVLVGSEQMLRTRGRRLPLVLLRQTAFFLKNPFVFVFLTGLSMIIT
jgi:hypothetical protein